MKKSIFILLIVLSSSLFAASGKAIIPNWTSNSPAGSVSYFTISNITDNYISVTIKLYDQYGNVLSPTSYRNFVSSNTQLEPKSSGLITISFDTSKYGFGVIEWKNLEGDDDTVALVANGFRSVLVLSGSRRGDYSISVNNGLPF